MPVTAKRAIRSIPDRTPQSVLLLRAQVGNCWVQVVDAGSSTVAPLRTKTAIWGTNSVRKPLWAWVTELSRSALHAEHGGRSDRMVARSRRSQEPWIGAVIDRMDHLQRYRPRSTRPPTTSTPSARRRRPCSAARPSTSRPVAGTTRCQGMGTAARANTAPT